jgi:hypothetical protein
MFPSRQARLVLSLLVFAASSLHSSESARKAADRPVNCISRVLHAQPEYVDGRLTGIKLFPNEPPARQFFASLQLRAGDVFHGAGRTPQEDFSRLEDALFGPDKDPVLLNMVRNGQAIELQIPAAQIRRVIEFCQKPG